ncbi:Zn-ribbon domain-containing OB-fold protein [Neobacillus citreus]|uniref:OB-fold domain-containing protein n=1 Tax=Neobacillus citreus TaxID=2833578 RepID=A0A942YB87_9BACI|nr:OB-fold domain-containing protein [Neobacillus citreus]MCH6267279.1 OB-fold domain-containing protein [Neobacillus citreus]
MMVRYNPEAKILKPQMNEDTKDYWALLQETKKLHLQRCKHCQSYMHPPRPVCHKCRKFDMEWVPADGKGTIYSYVVYQRSTFPTFKVPYEVVLVELEEGVRIVSNMIDCEPDELFIGMPVEVVVDQVTPELALPKFKRRNT